MKDKREGRRYTGCRSNSHVKKKAVFLDALSRTASVTKACILTKIPRRTVYEWRLADEAFKKQWDDAIELSIDALEDEAVRRAFEGVRKPVFQGGKRVGHIQEYSDTLLIFMLKGRRPERFKDRAVIDHGNKDEKPFVVEAPATADEEDWNDTVEREMRLQRDVAARQASGEQ